MKVPNREPGTLEMMWLHFSLHENHLVVGAVFDFYEGILGVAYTQSNQIKPAIRLQWLWERKLIIHLLHMAFDGITNGIQR